MGRKGWRGEYGLKPVTVARIEAALRASKVAMSRTAIIRAVTVKPSVADRVLGMLAVAGDVEVLETSSGYFYRWVGRSNQVKGDGAGDG